MTQPLSTNAVDFLLTTDNEWDVSGGDLALVRGVDAVAQLCRIAVQTYAEEWFLDLDRGISYWDKILGVNPALAKTTALAEFRDTLLAVPGVLSIITLTVVFSDASSRTLTVTWQVKTAAGDTPIDSLTTGQAAQ